MRLASINRVARWFGLVVVVTQDLATGAWTDIRVERAKTFDARAKAAKP